MSVYLVSSTGETTFSSDKLSIISSTSTTTDTVSPNDSGKSSGIWYFEITVDANYTIGQVNGTMLIEDTITTSKASLSKYVSVILGTTGGVTTGFLLDLAKGILAKISGGTSTTVLTGLKTDGSASYRPYVSPYSNLHITFNFGQKPFVYSTSPLVPFSAQPYDETGSITHNTTEVWSASNSVGGTISGPTVASLNYNRHARSFIQHTSGKYYAEITYTGTTNMIGVSSAEKTLPSIAYDDALTQSLYIGDLSVYPWNSTGKSSGIQSLPGNSRVGLLIDLDARTVQFKTTSETSVLIPLPWTGATSLFVSGGAAGELVSATAYTKDSDFTLGMPAGYKAWGDTSTAKYLFYANSVYYTHNGTALVSQGSTPDWATAMGASTLSGLTYDNCYKDLPTPYDVVCNETGGFTTTAYPTASVITTNYPITSVDLAGYASVASITIDGAEGHFALSFDKGTTWKAFKSGVWNTVTLETLDSNSMTHAEIEALTSSNISSIFQATQLDLACAVTDTEAFNGFTVTLPANQPPTISNLTVTPATTHNQDIVISYSVVDPEGSPCKSRVRLDGAVLAPLFEVKSNPVSVTMQASKLPIGATKTIEVYAQDAFGASATASITVSRQNQDPTAIVTMTGNRVQATITDPDADTIRYEVRLNDEVIVPQSNLLASPVSLDFVIPTDKIILGGANTLTIYYQDSSEFKNIAATHTFTGVAYGLLFKDSVGDVLNKLDNSILKLLDIGTYYPGKGGVVKASIWNNTGYDYNGVTISLSDYIAPNSIRLSFDEFKPYPQWTDSIVSTVAFPIVAEIPFWVYFEAGPTSASVGVHSWKLIAEVS